MKKLFLLVLLIFLVPAFAAFNTTFSEGRNFNATLGSVYGYWGGYTHRITLDNSTGNYSKVKASWEGIAWYEGTCSSPNTTAGGLNYYFSETNATGNNFFWVKTVNANVTNICLYYANSSAVVGYRNGTLTFPIFFTGFETDEGFTDGVSVAGIKGWNSSRTDRMKANSTNAKIGSLSGAGTTIANDGYASVAKYTQMRNHNANGTIKAEWYFRYFGSNHLSPGIDAYSGYAVQFTYGYPGATQSSYITTGWNTMNVSTAASTWTRHTVLANYSDHKYYSWINGADAQNYVSMGTSYATQFNSFVIWFPFADGGNEYIDDIKVWEIPTYGTETTWTVGYTEESTSGPAVYLWSPTNGTRTSNNTLYVTVQASLNSGTTFNATNPSQIYFNETKNSCTTTNATNTTCSFSIAGVADGSYPNLIYEACDNTSITAGAGCTNTTARTLIIDRSGPSISIASPLNYTYLTSSVNVNLSASDGSNISSYWLNYNGTNTSFTPNVTLNLSEARYSLTVYVNDTLGNLNSSVANFTVHVNPPTLTQSVITSPDYTTTSPITGFCKADYGLDNVSVGGIDFLWYQNGNLFWNSTWNISARNYCYQSDETSSGSCGASSGGNYSCVQSGSGWLDCGAMDDNDYSTYSYYNAGSFGYITKNYTTVISQKPVLNARIGTLGSQNYTLPEECFSGKINVSIRAGSGLGGLGSSLECYGSSGWVSLATSTNQVVYEIGNIYWDITRNYLTVSNNTLTNVSEVYPPYLLNNDEFIFSCRVKDSSGYYSSWLNSSPIRITPIGVNITALNVNGSSAGTSFTWYATNGTTSTSGIVASNPGLISYTSLPQGDNTTIIVSLTDFSNATTGPYSINASMGVLNVTTTHYRAAYFYAVRSDTSASITSFTINVTSGTAGYNGATSTGILTAYLDQLPSGSVNVTVISIGYNTTLFYYTWSNSSVINQTFSLAPAALTVNVYNEDTLAAVGNYTLTISNGTTTLINTTSGTFQLGYASLPQGNVTIDINASGYLSRQYVATISAFSAINLNAYLLNESTGTYVRFHITTSNGLYAISDALVSSTRYLNGSYVTVEQEYSDSTGIARLSLSPFATYIIRVEKTGCTTYVSGSLVPSQSDYYIGFCGGSGNVTFTTIFDDVSVLITPSSVTPFASSENFTCYVSSISSGLVNYTFTLANSSSTIYTYTVTTSPAGGSIPYNVTDLLLRSGLLTASCSLYHSTYGAYTVTSTYLILNYTGVNTSETLESILTSIKCTTFASNFTCGLVGIVGTGAIAAGLASMSPAASGIGAILGLGLFTNYGFMAFLGSTAIQWSVFGFLTLVILVMLYRRYQL